MTSVATIIVAALVGIVAVVGGVVTITHPSTLPFDHYVAALTGLAASAGLLGIGRGVHAAARENTLAAAMQHDQRAPTRAQPNYPPPPDA